MKRLISRVFLILAVVSVFLLPGIALAEPSPTGQFGRPFNENQTWSACGSSGWLFITQYNMQYNNDANVQKYHMGEDWNGMCGGDSDLGAPLYAIADGQVIFLDNEGIPGQGKRLYVRYIFPYTKESARLLTFDSAYYHLNGMANGITWTQGVPWSGSVVTLGQTVAYLGNTGTSVAHLHWEAQKDLTIPLGSNPYKKPLTIIDALKYRAPSIIVDDHQNVSAYQLVANQWTIFTMTGNAPSSTAYVKYGGQLKTIKDAATAGWVNSYGVIFSKDGGSTWQYYADADDNFFENGVMYAIYASVTGATFHMPVPQNQYQEDRARMDMIHAVENDADFASVETDTYIHDPNWDPNFELHYMEFILSGGAGFAYVNQATRKANPLERYTSYWDPTIGTWTPWQLVDWNKLY